MRCNLKANFGYCDTPFRLGTAGLARIQVRISDLLPNFVVGLVQRRRILRESPCSQVLFGPVKQSQRVHPSSTAFVVSRGTLLLWAQYLKRAFPIAWRSPRSSIVRGRDTAYQSTTGIVPRGRASPVRQDAHFRSMRFGLRPRDDRRREEPSFCAISTRRQPAGG